MIAALIQGAVFKSETKTSKAGKPFTVLPLRVQSGNEQQFVKAMLFGEAEQETISGLPAGAAVAVRGTLKTEVWAPAGREPRVNITVMADGVLPLKKTSKPAGQRQHRQASAPPPQQIPMTPLTAHAAEVVDQFGDQLPF